MTKDVPIESIQLPPPPGPNLDLPIPVPAKGSPRQRPKERDLSQAIRAATKTGLPVTSYGIKPDGTIYVCFTEPDPQTVANDVWTAWEHKRGSN